MRTSIWARGSRPPATAARCCSRRRRATLVDGRAALDLGRAPPQGLRRAGLDLPARLGALPAAEDDLEHEPAAAGKLVRRPRARRWTRSSSLLAGRRAPGHAHRPRRLGQDAARDRGGRRARAAVQGRRVLGRAGDAPRPGARARDDRADARREGRPRRAHRRARAAAAARQPRAGGRRRARARRARRGLPEPARCSSPAASCCASAARSSTRSCRSPSRRRSSSSARARDRAGRDGRRALPAARQPAARARARRRAGERALAGSRSSSGSRSGSTCSRAAATPIRASRRSARRSSGRYELLAERGAAAVRPAGRLRRRLHARGGGGGRATPTSTRSSRSSRRASSATRTSASGCWRRSASTPPSGSKYGDAAELARRHAAHFLALGEEADLNLRGKVADWLERLELDHDNFRSALDWLESARRDRPRSSARRSPGSVLVPARAPGRRGTTSGTRARQRRPAHTAAREL